LLKLLADPCIAGSQDSHLNTAAKAVLQQPLAPGVLHQLLKEDQESEVTAQGPQQQQQLVPALVQLVLQLGSAETCTAAALQGSIEAGSSSSSQLPQTEQMLKVLAAAAGYASTDELLGSCRSQLMEQVISEALHCYAQFCHLKLLTILLYCDMCCKLALK
jgi:hypothetical protein